MQQEPAGVKPKAGSIQRITSGLCRLWGFSSLSDLDAAKTRRSRNDHEDSHVMSVKEFQGGLSLTPRPWTQF